MHVIQDLAHPIVYRSLLGHGDPVEGPDRLGQRRQVSRRLRLLHLVDLDRQRVDLRPHELSARIGERLERGDLRRNERQRVLARQGRRGGVLSVEAHQERVDQRLRRGRLDIAPTKLLDLQRPRVIADCVPDLQLQLEELKLQQQQKHI